MEGPQPPQDYTEYQRQYGVGFADPSGQVRFEAISDAWNVIRSDFGNWILFTLTLFALQFVIALPGSIYSGIRTISLGPHPTTYPIDLYIVPTLINLILGALTYAVLAGAAKYALERIRGNYVTLGTIFQIGPHFASLLGAGLFLQGILAPIVIFMSFESMSVRADSSSDPTAALASMMGGFALTIILSCVVSIGMYFTPLLIVDQKLPAWAAIKLSFRAAMPRFFPIFGLLICVGLATMLGVCACVVGVLVTYPFMIVTQAIVYRDLFHRDPGKPMVVSDPNMMNPPTLGSL